jgi:hypothetical protein
VCLRASVPRHGSSEGAQAEEGAEGCRRRRLDGVGPFQPGPSTPFLPHHPTHIPPLAPLRRLKSSLLPAALRYLPTLAPCSIDTTDDCLLDWPCFSSAAPGCGPRTRRARSAARLPSASRLRNRTQAAPLPRSRPRRAAALPRTQRLQCQGPAAGETGRTTARAFARRSLPDPAQLRTGQSRPHRARPPVEAAIEQAAWRRAGIARSCPSDGTHGRRPTDPRAAAAPVPAEVGDLSARRRA